MKATADNWKDVHKYFQSTYIVVPEYSTKEAVFVEAVSQEGIKVKTESGERGFIENPYDIVNPLASRRRWFQGSERAGFIARIPARMWRKGISPENTTFSTISNSGGWTSLSTCWETVNSFVSGKEYITNIDKNSPIVSALSPLWAVRIGGSSGLFLLNSQVGKISLSKKIVHVLKEFKSIPLPVAFNDWKVEYV